MKSLWRGMAVLLLAMGCFVPAEAQVATTTLNDTVYRADGTPAQGSVVVTWGSFTMANGVSVPAGSKTAVLGSNGAFSMVLAPNAGATPMGSFYTAVYHLADGTVSREYWVIPVTVPGGGAAKLAGVRNQVLPSSVAMQTVSKQYVDSSIAQAQIGAYPLDSSPYVLKAGDTMTGPLELPGDPATPTQAADKNYVDTNVTALTSGLSGKVALLPSGTQVVGQPESTQLQTNRLNGELYASQFATSQNTDGITTALSSPECTDSSCTVIVEPTYPENAVASTDTATQSAHVKDERGASEFDTSLNPKSPSSTYLVGRTGLVTSTITAPEYYQSQHNSVTAGVLQQTMRALSGGSNLSPQSYTSLPYFKSTYGLEYGEGIYNTQGQHVNYTSLAGCYSVGDCIDRSSILTSDGGFRDGSDEGTHQYDYLTQEDPQLFQGTCDTGCVSGSTDLVVAVTAGGSTQGDGRYLMDTTAAKSITTGTLIGGDLTRHFVATFSGSSFPVSTFLATAEVANSQANDAAPGTVTLAIMSSGAPSGYATNTAALPNASGVACVADQDLPPFQIDNFETAAYTVIDGTHIQLTLNKPHDTGATIAVGGLCGYGLEQKVDTVGSIKQIFPVIGSISTTQLFYMGGRVGIVGAGSVATATAYANVQLPIASITRSGNVATVTTSSPAVWDLNALVVTIDGVSDPSFNGSFPVTSTSSTTFQFASTGADTSSSGGSLSLLTGSFALYPMAEVLDVMNHTSQRVDGTFHLAANTVAWAAGDALEEPHYFQQDVHASYEQVQRILPQANGTSFHGLLYSGNVGPGTNGFAAVNGNPSNVYYGEGGTHHVPSAAFLGRGAWTSAVEVDAGELAAMRVHCNLHGCGKWNSSYYLMLMDSVVGPGSDSLQFAPQTRTATWSLGGAAYAFSPSGFTAGTINVGTLNATTINGGVSADAINSGTIAAARLPVFGPSGSSHSVGAVPDPGATAGATRYLREDGTWAVPTGGSGGTGDAGGDLSGTYPNPTVAAVHATSGSLDNVTIGATTPGAASFTQLRGSTAVVGPVLSGGDSNLVAVYYSFGSMMFGPQDVNFGPRSSFPYGLNIGSNGTTAPLYGLSVGLGQQFQVDQTGNVVGTSYQETLMTPASSSSSCTAGQFADDANYHYVCVATNTWKRAALSSF